ncbi:hypothetical protein QYM36_002023 [Artemia franciscana]|uniref:Uncharacterized protein n=1 Tax=Artemia franciscana TaxID=6661 RepID=A0AA88I902_ARTSF|nr:hypothetical protein QYM36_002023 [Artemia franciscana]
MDNFCATFNPQGRSQWLQCANRQLLSTQVKHAAKKKSKLRAFGIASGVIASIPIAMYLVADDPKKRRIRLTIEGIGRFLSIKLLHRKIVLAAVGLVVSKPVGSVVSAAVRLVVPTAVGLVVPAEAGLVVSAVVGLVLPPAVGLALPAAVGLEVPAAVGSLPPAVGLIVYSCLT